MMKAEIMKRLEKTLDAAFPDLASSEDLNVLEILEEGVRSFERSLQHEVLEGVPHPDYISIWWCVDDVRYQAGWDDETGWPDDCEYDTTKMHEVLHTMKRRHDCSIGISWETLDCHLDDVVIGGE